MTRDRTNPGLQLFSGGCYIWLDFPSQTLSMSEYDIRPGGSLKLKGGVTEGGIVKK